MPLRASLEHLYPVGVCNKEYACLAGAFGVHRWPRFESLQPAGEPRGVDNGVRGRGPVRSFGGIRQVCLKKVGPLPDAGESGTFDA